MTLVADHFAVLGALWGLWGLDPALSILILGLGRAVPVIRIIDIHGTELAIVKVKTRRTASRLASSLTEDQLRVIMADERHLTKTHGSHKLVFGRAVRLILADLGAGVEEARCADWVFFSDTCAALEDKLVGT